ncbi:flavin-binding monooxygenase-like family protein [Macrophomina phaseolina]|uniref:Flavin-binding monooxygenase-like family protein n=1 Tax=Macrophomina phaseolina TaxID=35725 RepID=A0ABQ8FQH8_9PEZI|nr:flavin-binding monooxygenase-like family protein [Macrophomina phaseolina]
MTAIAVTPDAEIQAKYAAERQRRLRPDAANQYVDLDKTEKYKYLHDDPWVDHDVLNAQTPALKNGDECKFLILGAGYGGLIFAVRFIQAGFSPSDIRLVDSAGGFGGTWYWNRYPGLMCDVESYIYMPLLEETNYMPKHKYSYGPELREHADRIAQQFSLTDKALFRAQVKTQRWDKSRKQWAVSISEYCGPAKGGRELQVRASFVILTGGLLNVPHIPKLPGLDVFQGQHFHTARWNYGITGGSPEAQTLDKLRDKRVGIIGTGSTAIQVVPELARWSKHVYVFQRTPSSCDVRGQHATDPAAWPEVTENGAPGWQKRRAENFNAFVMGQPEGREDLVRDGWCQMPSFSTLVGASHRGIVSLDPESMRKHVEWMDALDFPRAERVRARVDAEVRDKAKAEKLKGWYPTYCKRPGFHDEYLQAFNNPSVDVIDTHGQGVDRLTETGVVVAGEEYPVDVLVLSTGFRGTATGAVSPGWNASVKVYGRGGVDMDDKWAEKGPTTLHGLASHDFPSLFFWSPSQTGMACNITYVLDLIATHAAFIVAEANKKAAGVPFSVEPSIEAEEWWSEETAKRSGWFAPILGCTPGYFNLEGQAAKELADEESAEKKKRAATWGEGSTDYANRLARWRSEGTLQGVEIVA